jgi:hypothetical protein
MCGRTINAYEMWSGNTSFRNDIAAWRYIPDYTRVPGHRSEIIGQRERRCEDRERIQLAEDSVQWREFVNM